MKRKSLIISILMIFCTLPSSCQKVNQMERNEEGSINKNLVLQLINDYRTSGCNCGAGGYFAATNPVIWNDTLELAAKVHSTDMYSKKFFSHTGSDGSKMSDRIQRLGYNWKTCGENIGQGYKNEEQVVNGWINSSGHCSNIMDPKFKEIGVAKVGEYWTLVFGAR